MTTCCRETLLTSVVFSLFNTLSGHFQQNWKSSRQGSTLWEQSFHFYSLVTRYPWGSVWYGLEFICFLYLLFLLFKVGMALQFPEGDSILFLIPPFCAQEGAQACSEDASYFYMSPFSVLPRDCMVVRIAWRLLFLGYCAVLGASVRGQLCLVSWLLLLTV